MLETNTEPDPDPIRIQGFNDQKLKKKLQFFWSKTAIYLSLDLHKVCPSYRRSLQFSKEAIQHFKTWTFTNYCLLLWVIFALLDPDPDSGSGSTDPIEYGSNLDPDPDPQPCKISYRTRIKKKNYIWLLQYFSALMEKKREKRMTVNCPLVRWTCCSARKRSANGKMLGTEIIHKQNSVSRAHQYKSKRIHPLTWSSKAVLRIRIPDLVPFWPLDPGSGLGKKSRSGSRMNISDHISERLQTFFWGLKILKFFDADRDPRSGIF